MNIAAIDRSPTDASEQLARATDAARDARPSVETLTAILRTADALHAAATRMLASLTASARIERTTGLPVETLLRLDGRRTHWDARELCTVSDTLGQMPHLAAALDAGDVSWSQARAIARAIKHLDANERARIDQLIGGRSSGLRDAEPETLVALVDDIVGTLRADLMLRREDRAIETSFLALQPRLDGGGSLYGQADAEGFATIAEALDAMAARPVSAEQEPSSRARQRMDALIHVCERTLAGDERAGSTRPRPRFLATIDLTSADPTGASILWPVAGRPARITPLAANVLLCDADITPVVFAEGEPVGAGRTSGTIPATVRATLVARDGGCRFPGCGAPASWTDAHHIHPRRAGRDDRIQNLVLLCRRCHRRIHRHRWRITVEPDDTIRFTHRARSYTSRPRARPPCR